MRVTDAVAFAGHQVHVCRWREAGTMLRWLGPDLHGLRVLDVAGGDGYWAGQARRRGAHAVAVDIAGPKLRRGSQLAGALTRAGEWPHLFQAHCDRYAVQRTYTHDQLAGLLGERGLDVAEYAYQFRSRWSERLYLTLSAHGGQAGFNAAAPLAPLVAAADHRAREDRGAIVLVRARRRGPASEPARAAMAGGQARREGGAT
jgi:hypothetical protein